MDWNVRRARRELACRLAAEEAAKKTECLQFFMVRDFIIPKELKRATQRIQSVNMTSTILKLPLEVRALIFSHLESPDQISLGLYTRVHRDKEDLTEDLLLRLVPVMPPCVSSGPLRLCVECLRVRRAERSHWLIHSKHQLPGPEERNAAWQAQVRDWHFEPWQEGFCP
ncbi:hypothetical protein PT974_04548 [Cladobotryum mycophilum]|uniref:F-box domain-containing protein n=1 Tax=Cladobotryum mycophilum TaxID=491253 RepID=A0ABR0SWI6_9HYPO